MLALLVAAVAGFLAGLAAVADWSPTPDVPTPAVEAPTSRPVRPPRWPTRLPGEAPWPFP